MDESLVIKPKVEVATPGVKQVFIDGKWRVYEEVQIIGVGVVRRELCQPKIAIVPVIRYNR